MVFKTCLFFIALACAGQCNPLGQTTLCEQLPNILPSPGSTTVCESTPNLLGFGLGLGPLGLNLLPNMLPQYGLGPFGPLPPVQGSTTVCESMPNLGLGPFYDPLNLGLNYLPLPTPNLPVPSTTVCESTPNLFGLPGLPYPLGGLPYGLQRPGLPLGLSVLGGVHTHL